MVIVAPNSMAFRALVESDILLTLKEQGQQNIIVLSSSNESRDRLPEGVQWRDMAKPCEFAPTQTPWRRSLRALSVRLSEWLGMGYGNIAFRFNQLHGFQAHRFKQKMDKERQQREALAGNYVNPKFGWPFPGSRWLYKLIYGFYYARWQIPDRSVEQFFEETPISTVVLWYVQNSIYRDYSLCIRKRGIRAVGVIGSWDRPTTKGPICPGCIRYVVNGEKMKQDLVEFHGIAADEVEVVGWPQMDIYKDTSAFQQREEFLSECGIEPNHRLMVFAGNSERLGLHEPGLVEFMQQQLNAGIYGENISLLVRTHPNDNNWQQRYQSVIDKPNVVVMPAGMGNIALLANTLTHADIVIATQGSISLDAAAFDKCVINIAFDGYLQRPHHESVTRWYEMDHYRPVVESGGVKVVNNFDEIDEAIKMYLSDPQQDSDGRARLRDWMLAPFDGKASLRQVTTMIG